MVREKVVVSEDTKKRLSRAGQRKKWVKQHLTLCEATNLRGLKNPLKHWKSTFSDALKDAVDDMDEEYAIVARAAGQCSNGDVDMLSAAEKPLKITRNGKEALEQALISFSDDYFKIMATIVELNGRKQPTEIDVRLAKFVTESRSKRVQWRVINFTDSYLRECFESAVSKEQDRFGCIRDAILKSCRLKEEKARLSGVEAPEIAEASEAREASDVQAPCSTKKQLRQASKEMIMPKKKSVVEHLKLVTKTPKHSTDMGQTRQHASPWTALIREIADGMVNTLKEDSTAAFENEITAALLENDVMKTMRVGHGLGDVGMKDVRISKKAIQAICEAALDYLHQYYVFMDVVSAIRGRSTITNVDFAIAQLAIDVETPVVPIEQPHFTERFLGHHHIDSRKIEGVKKRRKQLKPKRRLV